MADRRENGAAGTWEEGFAGHERAQLARLAAVPFREKLRWLEEAQRLARYLREKGARSDGQDRGSPVPGI